VTSAAANVHFIKPKSMKRQYKRQTYTVTFIPATKKWKWEVTVVIETKFSTSDIAETQIKAFRAAEKFIDQHVKGS
jgi:hypothetical protein